MENNKNEIWTMLNEKGLSTNEKLKVLSYFSERYKNNYPFIGFEYKKGNVEYYHSTIDEIKHYYFKKEEYVILANAIYENLKDNFNNNEFTQILKFVFRLLNIQNEWS